MDIGPGHVLWVSGILLVVLPDAPQYLAYRSVRWLGISAALIAGWFCVPLVISLTMHPGNEKDDFFYVAAWTFREPGICGKIDANAIGRADQREDIELSYMQSDCYRNVGVLLRNPKSCDELKSAGVDRLTGSAFTKAQCRKERYTAGTAMPLDGEHFVHVMRSVVHEEEVQAWQNRIDASRVAAPVTDKDYWDYYGYLSLDVVEPWSLEQPDLRRDFVKRVLAIQ